MNIIDFSNAKTARGVFYGGDAGAKEAILHDDATWMIKYPKTTRDLINPQISYTTSPLSEYLGSKIYELLGLPTHEVLLGTRKGKIVVACKDFTWLTINERTSHKPYELIHFHYLKNTFMSSDLESYSGTGSETLLDEVEKRLSDTNAMEQDAFKSPRCVYKYRGLDNESHSINPFEFIENTKIQGCRDALDRFLSKINMGDVRSLIDEIPEHYEVLSIMPHTQKRFYIKLIEIRLDKLASMKI
ncbi:MAG: hypothetical protein FWF78_07120 [Defluviitaleaceae bacterium]|nr:hypothetical protein [Defluviitaleaceae bacterium]